MAGLKHERRDTMSNPMLFVEAESGNVDIDKAEEWKAFLALVCVMDILQPTFSTWMVLDTFIMLSQIQLSIKYQNHAKEENYQRIELQLP